MNSTLKRLARILDPIAKPVAASGLIPIWGVVHHTGRRSGRAFATPIALGATADSFFVPLPWGDGTDWCRNLTAAAGGTITYRGREFLVSDPVVVGVDAARPAFPRPIQMILPYVGIARFVRLRRGEQVRSVA